MANNGTSSQSASPAPKKKLSMTQLQEKLVEAQEDIINKLKEEINKKDDKIIKLETKVNKLEDQVAINTSVQFVKGLIHESIYAKRIEIILLIHVGMLLKFILVNR